MCLVAFPSHVGSKSCIQYRKFEPGLVTPLSTHAWTQKSNRNAEPCELIRLAYYQRYSDNRFFTTYYILQVTDQLRTHSNLRTARRAPEIVLKCRDKFTNVWSQHSSDSNMSPLTLLCVEKKTKWNSILCHPSPSWKKIRQSCTNIQWQPLQRFHQWQHSLWFYQLRRSMMMSR